LVAATLAAFLLVIGLTIALGAYTRGAMVVQRSRHRAIALAVAEAELERIRADGYAALPAGGLRPISDERLEGLPAGRGAVAVARTDSPTLKRVDVTVSWETDTEPAPGRVALASLISAHGMDP
jgi:hypothetical protein